MTMLDMAEQALVQTCETALVCFIGAGIFDVDSGPGDWDGSYLKTLLPTLPAVRVVWDGAGAKDHTDLTLESAYSIMVVNGWKGEDPRGAPAWRPRGLRHP